MDVYVLDAGDGFFIGTLDCLLNCFCGWLKIYCLCCWIEVSCRCCSRKRCINYWGHI